MIDFFFLFLLIKFRKCVVHLYSTNISQHFFGNYLLLKLQLQIVHRFVHLGINSSSFFLQYCFSWIESVPFKSWNRFLCLFRFDSDSTINPWSLTSFTVNVKEEHHYDAITTLHYVNNVDSKFNFGITWSKHGFPLFSC